MFDFLDVYLKSGLDSFLHNFAKTFEFIMNIYNH